MRWLVACWVLVSGWSLAADQVAPAALLRDLGADEFKIRETAENELRQWAEREPVAAGALFEAQMDATTDPEMRMRCRTLLKHVVLLEYRKQGEGYVGIQMREEPLGGADGPVGIRVIAIVPDTPAAKAGIQVGDLILRFEGKGWNTVDATLLFGAEIRKRRPGQKVKMQLRRGAAEMDVEVELARRPDLLAENNGFLLGGFGLGGDEVDFGKVQARLQAQAEEKYFEEWLETRKRAKNPIPPAKNGE